MKKQNCEYYRMTLFLQQKNCEKKEGRMGILDSKCLKEMLTILMCNAYLDPDQRKGKKKERKKK